MEKTFKDVHNYLERNSLKARVVYQDCNKKTSAALVAQGGKLETVNKKRSDAKLAPLEDYKNVSIVKKDWNLETGIVFFVGPSLYSATCVMSHHVQQLKEIIEDDGYVFDTIDNGVHTSFYVGVKPETKSSKSE